MAFVWVLCVNVCNGVGVGGASIRFLKAKPKTRERHKLTRGQSELSCSVSINELIK